MQLEAEQEEDLELEQIISLVEGPVSQMKEFLSQRDLSDEELHKLLEAEQAGKDRKTAKNLLKREISDLRHEEVVDEEKLGDLKLLKTESGETKLVAEIKGFQLDVQGFPLMSLAGHQFRLEPGIRDGMEQQQQPIENLSYLKQGGGASPAYSSAQTVPSQQAPARDASQDVQRQRQTGETTQRNRGKPVQDNSTTSSPERKEPESKLEDDLEEVGEKISSAESSTETNNSAEESLKQELEEDKLEDAMKDIVEGEKEKLKTELKEKYGLSDSRLEGKSTSELEDLKSRMERIESKKQQLVDDYGVDEEELEGKSLEELRDIEEDLEELRNKRRELMGKYDLSEEEVEDRNLEELRDLEDRIEERKRKRKEKAEKYGIDKEKLKGKTVDELEEFAEKLEKKQKLAAELQKYGYAIEELQDYELEELHDLIDETKKKKELMDELGIEMDDQKISEIGISQLEDLKEEKERREELMQELKERGVDEKMLEKSSTGDLEKLKSDLESKDEKDEGETRPENPETDSENEKKNEEKDQEEKTQEQIEKEAEEDLEMLMGAVEKEEEEEEEEDNFMEYFDLKSEFTERWESMRNNPDSGDGKEDKYEKVVDLLEEYRELDERKASIKTAQVLKGYLEYLLDIDRELTYKELSKSLEELDSKGENVEDLISFFNNMHDAYTGNIPSRRIDKVIDSAEEVIDDLR